MSEKQLQVLNAAPLPAHLQGKTETQAGSLVVTADILPRISIKGSRFTFIKDKDTREQWPHLTLPVIVLAATPLTGSQRVYYKTGFNPDEVTPPDCSSSNGLIPDLQIADKVCHSCSVCPMSKFGSDIDKDGSPRAGKACKESKKLLVLPYNAEKGAVGSMILELNVPVMSLKNLSSYGRLLDKNNLDTFDVITELGFVPDQSYPTLTFTHIGYLDAEVHAMVSDKVNSADVQDHIVDPSTITVAAAAPSGPTGVTAGGGDPGVQVPPNVPPAAAGAAMTGFGMGDEEATATPKPAPTAEEEATPISTDEQAAAAHYVDDPANGIFFNPNKGFEGVQWNPTIHATAGSGPGKGGPSYVKDGSFRAKKGVTKETPAAQPDTTVKTDAGVASPPDAPAAAVVNAALAEISIEDVASLVGVTPLTYKRWRNGAVPRESRLDALTVAADKIWSIPSIKKNFRRVYL